MAEGKPKDLPTANCQSTEIQNVSLLTAIYSCKIKNVSPNFEGSAFQSDLDSFLSMCNDY